MTTTQGISGSILTKLLQNTRAINVTNKMTAMALHNLITSPETSHVLHTSKTIDSIQLNKGIINQISSQTLEKRKK